MRNYSHEDRIDSTKTTINVESGLQYVETTIAPGESKTLVRSDIVRMPRDTSGWRNPTPYTVVDETSSGFRGTRTTQTRYTNFPIYDQDIIVTGGQADLPAAYFTASSLPTSDGNDLHRAEVQALLKVRDQKFNAALFLAEADKSAAMIGSSATQLYRSYSAFRRGNFAAAARHLRISLPSNGKGAASRWLEYQYGWLPLLSDLKGAYEELRRPYRSGGGVIGVKSRVTSKEERKVLTNYQPYSVSSTISLQKRTQVCLWYKIDNPALLQASTVGLLNPLEVGWELIPFSFVLDWLVPIGDVLGALTATSGTTFLNGTSTFSVEASCLDVLQGGSFVNSPGSAYEYTVTGTGNATQSRRIFKMNRNLYRYSPVPVPYWKNPASVGHALNALALLRSIIR